MKKKIITILVMLLSLINVSHYVKTHEDLSIYERYETKKQELAHYKRKVAFSKKTIESNKVKKEIIISEMDRIIENQEKAKLQIQTLNDVIIKMEIQLGENIDSSKVRPIME